jgi:hypothetical protein
MSAMRVGRRSFLAAAAAAAVPTRVRAVDASQATARPVRLGGPIFEKSDDPEVLARAHRAKGYRAGYCPKLSVADADRVKETERAFARNDVAIAEVGRWVNLLDADPDKRRQNLATVTDGLAIADAIGARCCVDIAGSFSTTSWFGPHRQPDAEVLRCGGRERADDHRRREAHADGVHVRDDGLVPRTARMPACA